VKAENGGKLIVPELTLYMIGDIGTGTIKG